MAYLMILSSNMFAKVFGADWTRGWIYIFAGIVIAIILGTWAGAVAARKGRSMQLWFIIGFFLPIIGLVIIYILKPVETEKEK